MIARTVTSRPHSTATAIVAIFCDMTGLDSTQKAVVDKTKSPTGLEPAISRFVGGCLIHWATGTLLNAYPSSSYNICTIHLSALLSARLTSAPTSSADTLCIVLSLIPATTEYEIRCRSALLPGTMLVTDNILRTDISDGNHRVRYTDYLCCT